MPIADAMLMELEQEATSTRRLLERVPADKLTWKPHPKSMSLGQLALHIAQTPGAVANLVKADMPAPPQFKQAEAASTGEVLAAFDTRLMGANSFTGSKPLLVKSAGPMASDVMLPMKSV